MKDNNIEDSDVRKAIVKSDNNVVVLASAGTGKTHTIIDKIQYISDNDAASFKKIAAITFTDKAADELKERLHQNKTESLVVAQTMHAWVLNEILQPFLPNIRNFTFDGPIKFGFGAKKQKIKSFNEGLNFLNKYGEILSYVAAPKNGPTNPDVPYIDYGNDFAFQLAVEVLKTSQSASNYIKSAYRWIFVDEYQDVNKDQNQLIQYLIDNLDIKTVLVGDNKQNIYSFRGSNSQYLINFSNREDFKSFKLTHNFRSSTEIIAYSKLFDPDSREKNEFPWKNYSDVTFVSLTDRKLQTKDEKLKITEIVSEIMRENPQDSIMILRRKNSEISELKSACKVFDDFQTQVNLDYSDSEFADFFSTLIKIKFKTETLFELNRFIQSNNFHEIFPELKSTLDTTVSNKNDQEDQSFYKCAIKLSGLEIPDDDLQVFKTSLADEKQIKAVLEENPKYSILTVHKAKGLEADHVIYSTADAFWKTEFQKNTHYVAITRAKKKLWLLDTTPQYHWYIENLIALKQKRCENN